MEQTQKGFLLKKDFLVAPANIKKLKFLPKVHNTSSSEILCRAIDAFDPEKKIDLMEDEKLMKLVSEGLKQAISDTQTTRCRLNKTLKKLKR